MYTVGMSWILIQCLRHPIKEKQLLKTSWKFHAVLHGFALGVVVGVMAGQGMGNSVMETCFLQTRSWAEYGVCRVLLLVPLMLFTPLIVGAVSYAFFKYNRRYKKFILRHLAAVTIFSLAWFPVALLHFWNAHFIGYPPTSLRDVTPTQLAAIIGALSGFLTVSGQALVMYFQRTRSTASSSLDTSTVLDTLTINRSYSESKMTFSAIDLSYTVFAPISTLSGLLFLCVFLYYPHLRKPPNILIIWQTIAQTIFDLHWFSALFRSDLHGDSFAVCIIIGAVSVYAYFLAFMYTMCMSWVLVRCWMNPIKLSEMRRTSWKHHLVCHSLSLLIVVPMLAHEGLGKSVMTTCFIRTRSWAE